ncbi:MAG: hypothetical protein WDZ59_08185 [Pirellulales bacterium]
MSATATSRFAPPVARRVAVRFFWKECRRLAGLALGFGAIALLTMIVPEVLSSPAPQAGLAMVIAFGGGAMLSIAAAVTLFSVEDEEGTAELLRILPRSRGAVALGKVAAAISMIVLTTAALLLAARLLGGVWPPQTARAMAVQGIVALLEALAWGLVASLLCRNPLVAAVLAIASASLVGFTLSEFRGATPARLGMVALVGTTAGWLALRWPASSSTSWALRRRAAVRSAAIADQPITRANRSWRSAFARLVWQSIRQSWRTGVAVIVVGGFLSFAFSLIVWTGVGTLSLLFTPALMGAAVFRLDQRRNAYRFLSEHAGRPRTLWLARHVTWLAPLIAVGVMASLLASWLGVLYFVYDFPWYLGGSVMMDAPTVVGGHYETIQLYNTAIGVVTLAWCSVLTAFAYGQFFSLALRSDVFAAMLALFTSVLVAAWAWLVIVWRLPALWFVAPLGLMAMLSTWLRVRDWMFDRGGLLRWLAPITVLVAPIGLIAYATPAARLAQVADSYPLTVSTDRGEVHFEQLAAEASSQLARGRDVADAYRRLASLGADATPEDPFSGQHLDEFIELSRVECRLPPEMSPRFEQARPIENLKYLALYGWIPPVEDFNPAIYSQTGDVTQGGTVDLDGRLERLLACRRVAVQQENAWFSEPSRDHEYLEKEFVDWATADGQTADRIRRAIRQLEIIEEQRFRPAQRLANEYLQVRSIILGEQAPSFIAHENPSPRLELWFAYMANGLPGEEKRAEQALTILATVSANYLVAVADVAESPQLPPSIAISLRQRLRRQSVSMPEILDAESRMYRWRPIDRSRLSGRRELSFDISLAHHAKTSLLVAIEFLQPWDLDQFLDRWVDDLARRRAERVRLALIAYRLEHGDYPRTLEELTPDFLQPEQYRDPYATGPFGYAPAGLKIPPEEDAPYVFRNYDPVMPIEEPLLWCVGAGDAEPTAVRVRNDGDIGARTEGTDAATDSDQERDGRFTSILVLKRQAYSGGRGHFWMLLPK